MPSLWPFQSAPPVVKLVNAFAAPFDNAIATARTCYSSRGIVTPEEVARKPELRDRIARSTYQAGHHTILQHAHFQFSLGNVSRQFLWSFLHAHPFYNSEQVSQRYVEVAPDTYAIPRLDGRARELYERTALEQIAAYQRLLEVLHAPAAREYDRLFPARRKKAQHDKDVKKKAQEVARYVLPVATFAYLYHTVSGLTLLRYHRLCEQYDAPSETRFVVSEMVRLLLEHDPGFRAVLEEPIPLEQTPEHRFFETRPQPASAEFVAEFDRDLGGRVSRLVGRKPENEALVAQAVREVLGLPRAALDDRAAIELALSPAKNPYLGETLTLTTLTKVSRALHHASYTFKKKLSHTADSQDQRHRLTPGSRPILLAHATGQPDFVRPALIEQSAAAREIFEESMARSFAAVAALRDMGVPF